MEEFAVRPRLDDLRLTRQVAGIAQERKPIEITMLLSRKARLPEGTL
jgi:hypothetical protein